MSFKLGTLPSNSGPMYFPSLIISISQSGKSDDNSGWDGKSSTLPGGEKFIQDVIGCILRLCDYDVHLKIRFY